MHVCTFLLFKREVSFLKPQNLLDSLQWPNHKQQPLDCLCHCARGLPESRPYEFCLQRCRYVQCNLVLMDETCYGYMMKPYFKGNQSAINFIYCTDQECVQIPLMSATVHCGLLWYIMQCVMGLVYIGITRLTHRHPEQSNDLSLLTIQSCFSMIGMVSSLTKILMTLLHVQYMIYKHLQRAQVLLSTCKTHKALKGV